MHDGGMKTHRRKSTWVFLVILVVSLTACSASPKATYSTVEDLKEAFVKAGGECDEWDATHSVEGSAESGPSQMSMGRCLSPRPVSAGGEQGA